MFASPIEWGASEGYLEFSEAMLDLCAIAANHVLEEAFSGRRSGVSRRARVQSRVPPLVWNPALGAVKEFAGGPLREQPTRG